MTIRGAVATVRWGYHRAAELRQWVITRDTTARDVWHLSARVAHADPFLGTRSDLLFVVALKGGRAWQFPVVELALAGGLARGRLGPPVH